MAPTPASLTVPAPDTLDYLDEDVVTVSGQNFALVSFVSPEGNQRGEQCAMKIRGVFGTKEEASAHVKRLMRMDNSFDIYLVQMYKWLPVPPKPELIEDQEYSDQFLNDLIKGYKESQLAAKEHFAQRKRAVMEQGLEDALQAADPHPSTSAAPADETSGAGPSSA